MEATKKGPTKSGAAAAPAVQSEFGSKALSPQQPLYDNVTKQEEEQKLIAVLKSDGLEYDKDTACRRLAAIGTKAAVPALAALLSDEHLCDVARYGLETIPDPAVDETLRGALGKLKGRQQIGVINSIGIRKDAGAVDGLVKRLGDADAGVAAACAAALGKIGGPEATPALLRALTGDPAVVRPAVGEACVAIGDTLLAGGKGAEAFAIFDQLRRAELPKPIFLAATLGSIRARGNEGASLLVEQIKSNDWDVFDMALRLVRELPGAEVTRAVAAQVADLSPEKRILVLKALGDRRDAAALPVALELAGSKTGDAKVRIAALQAAAQLGDATVVPVLFGAALDPDAVVAEAARMSLAGIPSTDEKVNEAITARLADKDPKARRIAVEAVGKRHVLGAVATLAKAGDDSDAETRVAVLQALTEMALAHRGDAAARDAAKQAALALAEKLTSSNPTESAGAKKRLTEVVDKKGPVPMNSPGLPQPGEPARAKAKQRGGKGKAEAK